MRDDTIIIPAVDGSTWFKVTGMVGRLHRTVFVISEDREAELGKPELAQQFFDKLGRGDAIMISFAEHNGSYTAAYKNLFDWTSRIDQKVFQNKPMILLATSPGPGGAIGYRRLDYGW